MSACAALRAVASSSSAENNVECDVCVAILKPLTDALYGSEQAIDCIVWVIELACTLLHIAGADHAVCKGMVSEYQVGEQRPTVPVIVCP